MSLHDTMDQGLTALVGDGSSSATAAAAIGAMAAGLAAVGLIEVTRHLGGGFRVKDELEGLGGGVCLYPDSQGLNQKLGALSTGDLREVSAALQSERAALLEQTGDLDERRDAIKNRLREVSEARDEVEMAISMRPADLVLPRMTTIGSQAMRMPQGSWGQVAQAAAAREAEQEATIGALAEGRTVPRIVAAPSSQATGSWGQIAQAAAEQEAEREAVLGALAEGRETSGTHSAWMAAARRAA